jgi:restriction system protein
MTPNSRNTAPRPQSASRKQSELEIVIGIKQFAHDQVIRHIAERFSGHDLARLVAAILRAEGFQVEVAGPGPDGGVDILASKGLLGFDGPHICVQVKSSKHPEDVVTLRALQGTMRNFKAHQGLLVAWGGFTKASIREARQSHFQLRLWSAEELVDAIYRTYDNLPEEIQLELRLERVWVLTTEDLSDKQSRQICSPNRE